MQPEAPCEILATRFTKTKRERDKTVESLQRRHTPDLPVTERRDEVKAAVYAVVLDVLAVQATLVPEVLLKLLVDVVGDRLPATAETDEGVEPLKDADSVVGLCSRTTYHSVLFTASPNPGVSTMVSLSLTPFSSISTVCLVISTVCVIRSTNSKVCCPS